MGLNYDNLVKTGRAKAYGVEWSNEELEALVSISKETGKSFSEIAPFVRNGVMTTEALNKAVKSGVTPPDDSAAREIAKADFQEKVKEPKVKLKKNEK